MSGNDQVYSNRAPSALSTRSEKQHYNPRPNVPSRGAMSVASAPGYGPRSPVKRRPSIEEDDSRSRSNSQWFEEGEETEDESGQDDYVFGGHPDNDAYSSASAGSYQQSSGGEVYQQQPHQQQQPSPQRQRTPLEQNYDYYNNEQPPVQQTQQQQHAPYNQQQPLQNGYNGPSVGSSRPQSHQSVHSNASSKTRARSQVQSVQRVVAKSHSNASSKTRARSHVQSVQRVVAKSLKAIPPPPQEQHQPPTEVLEPYGSMCWYYVDVSGIAQGPFTDHQMLGWHRGNFFTADLRMRRGLNNPSFELLGTLFPNFERAFESGEGPCPAVGVIQQDKPGFV